MTRTGRSHGDESGVILIIVACAMVVLIGMLAIAIDASYGFVQNRRAQNASDFAAFAAAQQLNDSYFCNGSSAPTIQEIMKVIQDVVTDNDASVGANWSGIFLDSTGKPIGSGVPNGGTFSPTSFPALPPNGACGVEVDATPKWPPFFAGIFGVHQLGGFATAKVAPKATSLPNIGIVALNKYGPHEILGGGTGTFVVSGDLYSNTLVTQQPWSGSYADPGSNPAQSWEWDDAIDAKLNSNLYVYGTIHSQSGDDNGEPLWPLDTCFEPDILGNGNPDPSTQQQYSPGDPTAPGSVLPTNQMVCNKTFGGTTTSVTIDFDNIDPTATQIDDPLTNAGAPPDPLSATTNIACPGSAGTNVVNAVPAGGFTTLSPGEYTIPVEITGSATFQDCPGGYTGIYKFDDGLWINPQASGDQVNGNNVVISTESPYPLAGNVPGSVVNGAFQATPGTNGNGAPCLPSGTMTSVPSGNGTAMAETVQPSSTVLPCGGTNDYGAVAYHDPNEQADSSMSGTGNNFSLIIGGVQGSSVTLQGPTAGAYGGTNGQPGVVLYQDPNTEANYGFDAESGDDATVAINGVVYNASLADYGLNAPADFWDGTGGGIPFYAGGTLQTGYGTGWSGTGAPAESGGSVTLTGSAIVDDFNTDGTTGITIIGEPYTLPGGSTLSLIG